MDTVGARSLKNLHQQLAARGIALRLTGAQGRVRDRLRAEGLEEKVGSIEPTNTIESIIDEFIRGQPK